MNLAPKTLAGYSWNLRGSLAGILCFLAVSRMMLQPWVWLGIVLVGFTMLQATVRDRVLVLSLIVPLALLLHDPSSLDHYTVWTPYTLRCTKWRFRLGELRVNHADY
jgi:hypothetical protein